MRDGRDKQSENSEFFFINIIYSHKSEIYKTRQQFLAFSVSNTQVFIDFKSFLTQIHCEFDTRLIVLAIKKPFTKVPEYLSEILSTVNLWL